MKTHHGKSSVYQALMWHFYEPKKPISYQLFLMLPSPSLIKKPGSSKITTMDLSLLRLKVRSSRHRFHSCSLWSAPGGKIAPSNARGFSKCWSNCNFKPRLRARCEYSTATSSSEADKNASPVASTEHRNLTQEERKARFFFFFFPPSSLPPSASLPASASLPSSLLFFFHNRAPEGRKNDWFAHGGLWGFGEDMGRSRASMWLAFGVGGFGGQGGQKALLAKVARRPGRFRGGRNDLLAHGCLWGFGEDMRRSRASMWLAFGLGGLVAKVAKRPSWPRWPEGQDD